MKVKRIVADVLVICMLLCSLSLASEKRTRAEGVQPAYKSVVGDFVNDSEGIHLSIKRNGKKYVAVYRQVRLCTMDNLKGTVKKGTLVLKGLDPAGNPITVTLSPKGKKRVFTFKKTTWNYFSQGNTVILKKIRRSDT